MIGRSSCRVGGARGLTGSSALDELGLDALHHPLGVRVVDPLDQQSYRGGPEPVDRLPDAGELDEVKPAIWESSYPTTLMSSGTRIPSD
jgi:hypothetical protein